MYRSDSYIRTQTFTRHHFSWFSPHWVTFYLVKNQWHFIMPKLKVQTVKVPIFLVWIMRKVGVGVHKNSVLILESPRYFLSLKVIDLFDDKFVLWDSNEHAQLKLKFGILQIWWDVKHGTIGQCFRMKSFPFKKK